MSKHIASCILAILLLIVESIPVLAIFCNSSVKCIILLCCKTATKFSRNPRRDRKGEKTALHFCGGLWECCLWIHVPMTAAKKQHVQSCELCLPFDRVNNKEETEFPCPKGAKTAKLIQHHQWGLPESGLGKEPETHLVPKPTKLH